MPERLPISVCIISGADALRIGRALESVAGWASEIVVVLNAEVTDGTEELAQRFGAKVFREPWKGFLVQKNSVAAKASQPWLLGLDVDEAVSPALREEMARLFGPASRTEWSAAYSFPRCTLYLGRWVRHGDWYPDRQTRLWQRGRAVWGGVEPHTKLIVSGPVGRLRGDLLHHTSENLDHTLRKTVAYADAFVRQCRDDGRRVTTLDLLARPAWRFFRGYCLRRGFLDGWQGLSVAWMGAFYTYLRYAKAMEAQRPASNNR
jgi:glycosyltransferase involved in cell wall biosynthesis